VGGLLGVLTADLLTPDCQVEWVVVKGGGECAVPITEAYTLTAVLTPTPRWPDAMCIIDPISKVVFTSKLFSAHVAPDLVNPQVGSSTLATGSCAAGAGPVPGQHHAGPGRPTVVLQQHHFSNITTQHSVWMAWLSSSAACSSVHLLWAGS
jgi:hypothetical protein